MGTMNKYKCQYMNGRFLHDSLANLNEVHVYQRRRVLNTISHVTADSKARVRATLSQAVRFGDGQSVHRALVPTRVQSDAACFVFDVGVLSCDGGALQRDICPVAAQRGPPCNQRNILSASLTGDSWEYFGEVFLGSEAAQRSRSCGRSHKWSQHVIEC